MYKITHNGTTTYANSIKFIKCQANGVVILCNKEEAQGMVSFDDVKNWAFKGKGLEEKLDTVVEFEEISLEEYLNIINAETQQQVTDIELAIAEMYETVLGGTE